MIKLRVHLRNDAVLIFLLSWFLWGCAGTELFVADNGKIVPNVDAFYVRKSKLLGSKLNLYEMNAPDETWVVGFISRGIPSVNDPFTVDLAFLRCPGPEMIYITRSQPMGFLSPPSLEQRAQQYIAHRGFEPRELSQRLIEIQGQKAFQLEYVVPATDAKVKKVCSTEKSTTDSLRIKDVIVELGTSQVVVLSYLSDRDRFSHGVKEFDRMAQTFRIVE